MYDYCLKSCLLLCFIYSGSCFQNIQIPLLLLKANAGQLAPSTITSIAFIVQWNEADFSDSTGKFTFTADGPDSQLCEIQVDCNAIEGNPTLCIFKNVDYPLCDFLSGLALVPCLDLTVKVTRGGTSQSVAFNLAPDIKSSAIDPQLVVDGNKASLSWTNSFNSHGSNTSCATRAKATLQVGVGNEWMDGPTLDITLNAPSSQDWTLDDCQQGDLRAKVVYLTKTGDFPTFVEFNDKENLDFPGVGVTGVSADASGGSCSLVTTWVKGCSEVDHYTVTCAGDENNDITDTSYTCDGLTGGPQTVTVLAYLTGVDTIGVTEPTTEDVPYTAPDAPAVASVVGNDATPTKLTVTWVKPTKPICLGDVTGYTITALPGGTPEEVDDPKAVSRDLDGLQPCTDYTVEVAAKWSGGTRNASSNTTKTGSQDPGKPTAVTSSSADPTEIAVSWDASDVSQSCAITGYTVNWTPAEGDDKGEYEGDDTTSYTITGLTCYTEYTTTVTAKTKDKSTVSDQFLHTTADQVPEQVPNAVVNEVSNEASQLEVTWNKVAYDCGGGPTGYLVTWEVEGDNFNVTTEPSALSHIITGLEPCTEYTVNIAAISQTGITGLSAIVTGSTGIDAPGEAVPSIAEDSSTPSSLLVSWTQTKDNDCPITKYTVEWSPESGDGGGSGDIGGDQSDFNITSLICNTDYTVTVTAYTSDDKLTKSASITGTTNDTAPDQPPVDEVSAVEEDPTQLTATWSAPDYTCTGSLGDYSVTWTALGEDHTTGNTDLEKTATSFTIEDLVPCTAYDVTIASRSSTGMLGDPGTGTATTTGDVPGLSAEISRVNYTAYSLNVSWNKPPTTPPMGNPCNITQYTVKWSLSSDGAEEQETVVTEPHLNITDLKACSDYYITVTAATKKGDGKSTDKNIMATGVDAPPVSEVDITSTSRAAQVTWVRPVTPCELEFVVTYTGTTLWTNNQTTDPGEAQTVDDPQQQAELKNLLPYSKYDVCVTVTDGEKECNTSTTVGEVPSAPRDVALMNGSITDESFNLTWRYPEAENGILDSYQLFWDLPSGLSENYTVNATDFFHTISDLEEGNYSIFLKAVNNIGISEQSETIYCLINGPQIISTGGCGGGCVTGIVFGILLIALIITAVIKREKIKDYGNSMINRSNKGTQSNEESPYELREEAILKTEFRKYVEELELDTAESAYQRLNDNSPQNASFAATKPFNKVKNRYANIHPFDDTRVKLQLLRDGTKGSDYINANFVKFPDVFPKQFIASQGPKDSTIGDFWRMVWEHEVYDVVMLCNLTEKGKSKCAQYWTDQGERAIEFGDLKINCNSEEDDRNSPSITRYIEIEKNGTRRLVKQHHFLVWPDFGAPDNEDDMLRFLASVKGKHNTRGKNIVVHCSAGVGRTGTFIGLWVLTSLLEEHRSARSIDVHRIALMMRECRSTMIQAKVQYLYLHKCLLQFMENMDNSVHVSNEVEDEPIYGNMGNDNRAYQ